MKDTPLSVRAASERGEAKWTAEQVLPLLGAEAEALPQK